MRVLALVFLSLFPSPAASGAEEEERRPIQRQLENVGLGDSLRRVRKLYPPLRQWAPVREGGGELLRYELERGSAKNLGPEIELLRVGARDGRVSRVQAVYDERCATRKPLEELVVDLSMKYGEPTRRGMVYSWRDQRTLLRVFNEELPSADGKSTRVRPSIELSEPARR